MPLTAKGTEILGAMRKTYGSDKKAQQVFYASRNAGRIKDVDAMRKTIAGRKGGK